MLVSTLVPEVFLEFFLRERESEPRSSEAAKRERKPEVTLSLLAASRLDRPLS